MKKYILLFILIIFYLSLIFPFTSYMQGKPFAEKLGYVPQPEVLAFAVADQKQITAEYLVLKVLVYFGELAEKAGNRIYVPLDFVGMQKNIETAIKLDPYNMDSYYFAQAVMVWDMKNVTAANELLEYGMKYRTWDWYLPFFAGFNYGYFLKDYVKAAHYFKQVGYLTGNELYISLASRYFYESGRTDLAIAYLMTMEKNARNDSIKKSFQIRLEALKGVKRIEEALDRYRKRYGRMPSTLETLLKTGYLTNVPPDPYGGTFYLDEKGHVRTTSKFAFRTIK